jgi:spore coat polysaccharide biosynthesis protein SpsF
MGRHTCKENQRTNLAMMSSRTGIVILSRYTSSRLPGKALMKIQDKPVLSYIIERLMQVVSKEQIVIATSTEASDDAIAAYAQEIGVTSFRGPLENVAERFYLAAKSCGWEFAARINGDNIFVDTPVLAEMLATAATGKYDFISNVKGRTFPKGMSIEIVRLRYFESLLKDINGNAGYREHVTLYLYEHESGSHYYYTNEAMPEAAGIQMALDTPEDLERTRAIIKEFTAPHWQYNMREIMTILKTINYE